MFEIGVSARFEAAHRLVGDFGPATRMHGHTYRIEVVIRGPHLQPDGTLIDITRLQAELGAIVNDLHYRDLAEVPGLEQLNTTAENLAHYCWHRLAQALQGSPIVTLTVRIWENPDAYAAYEDQL
ncbi:MAG: 6-carboxytetrahydropterin synthase [Chloroflexia bacterium]|nr:6-carboxytetrahydropterin synthase [Chloroflexia bacterium]